MFCLLKRRIATTIKMIGAPDQAFLLNELPVGQKIRINICVAFRGLADHKMKAVHVTDILHQVTLVFRYINTINAGNGVFQYWWNYRKLISMGCHNNWRIYSGPHLESSLFFNGNSY